MSGKVYSRPENGGTGTSPTIATGSSAGIRIGERFYAHLVPITGTLPTDAHLHYDLELTFPDGGRKSLLDLGVLSGELPLGYAAGTAPSFVLPGDPGKLRLLHGSCRKLHGGGGDALILADQEIERTLVEEDRPRQFLFTGDQIYADDVHPALLKTIGTTARTLVGWVGDDEVPVGTANWTLETELDPENPQRKDFATKTAGFTSTKADAHLATLAEFLTMYVMAWSDALWPREAGGRIAALADQPSEEAERDEALTNLTESARALGRVRRVLANVPCYMMFDDHEVTDDWDIDHDWYVTVRANLAGRTVMRNGLLAYGLFQDWGNQPANYAPGKDGRLILDALSAPLGSAPAVLSVPRGLDGLLGLSPGTAIRWNWRHDFPSHRVTALDCRTRRVFPGHERGAPELMSAAEMATQIGGPSPRPVHVILSGTPILGAPAAELAQAQAVAGFTGGKDLTAEDGGREYDNEAWASNAAGFQNILKALAEAGGAIVVSGDVHYAFTAAANYNWRDGTTVKHANIVQACASSLSNADSMTDLIGAIGHPTKGRSYVSYGHGTDLSEHGARLRKASFPKTGGRVTVSIKELEAAGGLDFAFNVLEGLKPPAVLPINHWLTDEAVQAAAEIVLGLTPQAWYQISYEDEDRSYPDVEAEIDFPSGDVRDLFRRLYKDVDFLDEKQIVGATNFGSLTMAMDGGLLVEVKHEVYYRIVGEAAPDTVGTMRHVADAESWALAAPPDFRTDA